MIVVVCLTLLFSGSLTAQTNVTFQYFYDDLGQLTKVVDSTGNVVEYVYDPVGNILQIKRSNVSPGVLTVFSFTPQQGPIGQTVTIQGQGFSSTAGANSVQFNGTSAAVTSATANTLVTAVPPGAGSGPITVRANGQAAISSANFTVVALPVITSMSRKSALTNTSFSNVLVTGFNLSGVTFSFQPLFSPPAIAVTAASSDSSGTNAILSLHVGAQPGTFALTASNSAGSSSPLLTRANRFSVIDPRSTADSDGDGVPDVIEAQFGSDPLDASSVPAILPVAEAESLTVAVLNGAAPPHASPAVAEADSLTVSLLNGTAPPHPSTTAMEADSLTVSLLNGTAPPPPSTQTKEADSLTISLLNGAGPPQTSPVSKEADSLMVSLLNGVAPTALGATLHEADSLTTSLLNGVAPPVQPTVFEADSLTVSVLNSAPRASNGTQAGDAVYASLNQHPQTLHNGTSAKKRSPAKPKPRKRTQSNEGE